MLHAFTDARSIRTEHFNVTGPKGTSLASLSSPTPQDVQEEEASDYRGWCGRPALHTRARMLNCAVATADHAPSAWEKYWLDLLG